MWYIDIVCNACLKEKTHGSTIMLFISYNYANIILIKFQVR